MENQSFIRSPKSEGGEPEVLYLVLGHLCLREEKQSFIRSSMCEGGEPLY